MLVKSLQEKSFKAATATADATVMHGYSGAVNFVDNKDTPLQYCQRHLFEIIEIWLCIVCTV